MRRFMWAMRICNRPKATRSSTGRRTTLCTVRVRGRQATVCSVRRGDLRGRGGLRPDTDGEAPRQEHQVPTAGRVSEDATHSSERAPDPGGGGQHGPCATAHGQGGGGGVQAAVSWCGGASAERQGAPHAVQDVLPGNELHRSAMGPVVGGGAAPATTESLTRQWRIGVVCFCV